MRNDLDDNPAGVHWVDLKGPRLRWLFEPENEGTVELFIEHWSNNYKPMARVLVIAPLTILMGHP